MPKAPTVLTGRDLDRAVATVVYGRQLHTNPDELVNARGGRTVLPHYAADWALFGALVEHLTGRGVRVRATINAVGQATSWVDLAEVATGQLLASEADPDVRVALARAAVAAGGKLRPPPAAAG